MCGIIGYVGRQEAAPILLEGLERMEYRGYDSTGMAVCGDGVLRVCKKKGRVQVLREMSHDGADLPGTLGIGHTRWATHGEPNDVNAHPHMSQSGKFAVVHNGIIENFITLKEELQQKGYVFQSETDTEVVAQRVCPMPRVPGRSPPSWVSSRRAATRPFFLQRRSTPSPHTAIPAES